MSSHKKFRLADMIPNASHWFSMKLKQIGTKTTTTTAGSKRRRKKKKKNKTHHSSSSPAPPHYPLSPQSYHSRKSYHFTRQLTTNKTAPAPAPTTSPESLLVSVSAGWDSHSTPYTNSPKNSITNHHDTNSCNLNNRRDNLQVIHLDSNSNSLTEFHRITSHQQERHTLPPIKTVHNHGKKLKTTTTRHTTTTNNNFRQIRNPIIKVVVNEESLLVTPSSSPARKQRFTSGSSPGIRLRINSPRIARIPQLGNYYPRRKTTLNINSITSKNRTTSVPVLSSESLAIVKSSLDPQRDFRESMVEMIVENRINTANDLEDLLACYLSLNADEYHHVIIKVFKQLWFDLKRRQSS